MKKDAIKTIGKKQTSREDTLLFNVNQVEGLRETLDKDFSEWSDFDCWENLVTQQWIFARALDVYHGKKIDIKCECCEVIDFNPIKKKNISHQKCIGIKSTFMIQNILDEIVLAKERRESDGTYLT
tara:strand:- start:356 stop:733 length:378 start_codon:yes stop_codon:yes gene_type:complete